MHLCWHCVQHRVLATGSPYTRMRTDGVQAAETWVVNLIRNARLNAKIDSKVRADLQQPVCMF